MLSQALGFVGYLLLVATIVVVLFTILINVFKAQPSSVLCDRTNCDHPIPKRSKKGDAGFDLYCDADITIHPYASVMVPLGINVKVPEGSVGLLMPRSSLNKIGVHCFPGTIDSGYTGPMFAMLRNMNAKPVEINKGMRVCQLIPLQLFPVSDIMEEVSVMPETERGATGFGSTGDAAKI